MAEKKISNPHSLSNCNTPSNNNSYENMEEERTINFQTDMMELEKEKMRYEVLEAHYELKDLPNELLLLILTQLNDIHSVISFAIACKRFYSLIRNDINFWKSYFIQTFATVSFNGKKEICDISVFSIPNSENLNTINQSNDWYVNFCKKWKLYQNWKYKQTSQQGVLRGHLAWVRTLEIWKDHLFSGSNDGSIKIWNTRTGNLYKTLEDHKGNVMCLKLLNNSQNLLLSSSNDCTIKLWNWNKFKVLSTLRSHIGTVFGVSYDSTKNHLASCSRDSTIKIWDIEQSKCLETLRGHIGTVSCVESIPDEPLICSGAYDTTLKLWDLRSNTCVQTLEEHCHYVEKLQMFGKIPVSSSRDRTIRFWDLRLGRSLQILSGAHSDTITALRFYGNILVSGGVDFKVLFWFLGDSLSSPNIQPSPFTITTDSIFDVLPTESHCYVTCSHDIQWWNFKPPITLPT